MYVSVRVRMKVRNQLNNPTDKSRTCYTQLFEGQQMEKVVQRQHPGRAEKFRYSRELNRVTQAKVISMRYRLFIFHKSLSKRAQYFGISVPRKKCHRESSMSRDSESGKKFGNIIKSRWIIAAHPRRTLWSSGCEGMVSQAVGYLRRTARIQIRAGRTCPRREGGKERKQGEGQRHPLMPRHKVCITRYKAVEKGRK